MKLLILMLGVAFFLRIYWLPQNLFFGFEQGRDLLAVSRIISFEDLRLIGANTDVDGIYHGAFFYYFLAPFFLILGGNPLAITVFLILLNVSGILFLYKAVEKLFNKQTALVSVLLYAVSYSAIIYSRWLSNPNLIPFLTILLFYSLVIARGEKRFLYLAAFFWGLIFHLSLATAATLILPTLLFLFLYKIKLGIKDIIFIIAIMLLIFSPYTIFDFKHNHILSTKLFRYLQGGGWVKNHIAGFQLFMTEAVDSLVPFAKNLSLIILGFAFLSLIPVLRKKEVIIALGFVLLPAILYSVLGMIPIRHIYIIQPVFLSIIFAIALTNLFRKRFLFAGGLLLLLIVGANVWHLFDVLPESKNNFLQRSQRTYLGDQKKVLDFIYMDVQGKPFSYVYFSVPWWKPDAWEYLFLWYGNNKYGYVPLKDEKTQVFYAVWEPDEAKPIYKDNWYGELNAVSNIIEINQFGALGVEKREWKQKI